MRFEVENKHVTYYCEYENSITFFKATVDFFSWIKENTDFHIQSTG